MPFTADNARQLQERMFDVMIAQVINNAINNEACISVPTAQIEDIQAKLVSRGFTLGAVTKNFYEKLNSRVYFSW